MQLIIWKSLSGCKVHTESSLHKYSRYRVREPRRLACMRQTRYRFCPSKLITFHHLLYFPTPEETAVNRLLQPPKVDGQTTNSRNFKNMSSSSFSLASPKNNTVVNNTVNYNYLLINLPCLDKCNIYLNNNFLRTWRELKTRRDHPGRWDKQLIPNFSDIDSSLFGRSEVDDERVRGLKKMRPVARQGWMKWRN